MIDWRLRTTIPPDFIGKSGFELFRDDVSVSRGSLTERDTRAMGAVAGVPSGKVSRMFWRLSIDAIADQTTKDEAEADLGGMYPQ